MNYSGHGEVLGEVNKRNDIVNIERRELPNIIAVADSYDIDGEYFHLYKKNTRVGSFDKKYVVSIYFG